jgi:hypothetical protein
MRQNLFVGGSGASAFQGEYESVLYSLKPNYCIYFVVSRRMPLTDFCYFCRLRNITT